MAVQDWIGNGGPQYRDEPAFDAAAVTVGGGAFTPCRSLYVGAAGDLTVTMANGTSVSFNGIPAGTVLPVRIKNVTAGTAGDLVALY